MKGLPYGLYGAFRFPQSSRTRQQPLPCPGCRRYSLFLAATPTREYSKPSAPRREKPESPCLPAGQLPPGKWIPAGYTVLVWFPCQAKGARPPETRSFAGILDTRPLTCPGAAGRRSAPAALCGTPLLNPASPLEAPRFGRPFQVG